MASYDIFALIECVESKPCLWDKTLAVYKDKIQKRNAWREVCLFLEPQFDNFVDKRKDEIINEIITKWKNIKSAFMRSLKCKSGQAQKKKYMYATNLQFLLKVMTPQDTTESGGYEDPALALSSTDENNININNIDFPTSPQSPPHVPQRRNKKRPNPVDTEILKILRNTDTQPSDLENIDPDRAFFHSILPDFKQLTYSDKLDFKFQVMHLLKKYCNAGASVSNDTSHNLDHELRQNSLPAGSSSTASNDTSHNNHVNILDHDYVVFVEHDADDVADHDDVVYDDEY